MGLVLLMYILFGVTVLLLIFLIIGLFRRSQWEVKEQITVGTNPEKIFPYINQLTQWAHWTAWKTIESRFEGPEAGVGAVHIWKDKSSNGSVEIVESSANKIVVYLLKMENEKHILNGSLELNPQGNTTQIIWRGWGESGRNPFGKLMMLIFKPFIAKDFRKGLQNLKALVEKN